MPRPIAIANTDDDTLYQDERYWSAGGSYRFDVPNGDYIVDIKLAEIYPTTVCGRAHL